MKARPYQSRCINAVRDAFESHGSTLVVLPVGAGKTYVFSRVVELMTRNGGRAMILAHRRELIAQAAASIERVTGSRPAIEMADQQADLGGAALFNRSPVVVASKDSLRGMRLRKFDWSQFRLIVTDEAHHAAARSYRSIYDHAREKNPDIKHLGVTATPTRNDGKGLAAIFDSVAFQMDIIHMIHAGWLVPVRQQYVRVTGLDFSGLRTIAGDLDQSALSAMLEKEKPLHQMVSPTMEIVGDRRTLVFAASVSHAERIAEIMNRHRPNCAEFVSGKTPGDERAAIFERFGSGRTQFLVNVGIATEGWDDPATDGRGVQVIAMMRPTKSTGLYCQMIGRGTRPLPGTVDGLESNEERCAAIAASNKPGMLVLDYVGNAGRHRLVSAIDILGSDSSDDAVSRGKRKIKPGEEYDVGAALEEAEADAEREAERREQERELREAATRMLHEQRAALTAKASFQLEEINHGEAAAPVPQRPVWHHIRTATPPQVGMLVREGHPRELVERLTVAQASEMIDGIMQGPPTKFQIQRLEKMGLDPSRYTRAAARDAMRKGARV